MYMPNKNNQLKTNNVTELLNQINDLCSKVYWEIEVNDFTENLDIFSKITDLQSAINTYNKQKEKQFIANNSVKRVKNAILKELEGDFTNDATERVRNAIIEELDLQ